MPTIVDISQIPDAFYIPPLGIPQQTDHYFTNTAVIAEALGDARVRYAVFLRTPAVVAIEPALEFLRRNYPGDDLVIERIYQEGSEVGATKKIVEIEASHARFSALETLLLQYVGWPCVSAYNAYHMAMSLPNTGFLSMEARHVPGWVANILTGYGAAVGSYAAKLRGARGFIGTSTALTAPFFGQTSGMGTMPHALAGLVKVKTGGLEDSSINPMLETAKLFVKHIGREGLSILPDYDGKEVSQTLEVAEWARAEGLAMSVRLDTHGGRYLEGLDWDKSVAVLRKWTHLSTPDEIIDRAIGGISLRSFDGRNPIDVARRHLFDTGVTAAAIVTLRKALDDAGFDRSQVRIVGSSGFNTMKCQIMANLQIPLDVVGTGSFIPEKLSQANATADILSYDGKRSIKVGREYLWD